MKVSKKKIENVVSQVAGSDVIPLVEALKDKKNISEFKLAEDTGLEVNQIRNMLYRLFNENLVTFIRKKDKIKGWYIYYWTFNPKRVKYLSKDLKKRRIEKLKERLEREKSNQFYTGESKLMRLSFEQAMDFNFRCPESGELLYPEDNSATITEIEQEIADLEKELDSTKTTKKTKKKKSKKKK